MAADAAASDAVADAEKAGPAPSPAAPAAELIKSAGGSKALDGHQRRSPAGMSSKSSR
jgi:predicted RNA polymerase sigma factor